MPSDRPPTPAAEGEPTGPDPSVVLSMTDFEARVDATIDVEGNPDFMTVAFGSVWVGNVREVARIDPATNEVVAAIAGPSPCAGFDAGFGSVWVASCGDNAVHRLDPTTDEVIEKVEVPRVLPESALAVGAGSVWLVTVWVTNQISGTVVRIDPETNAPAAEIDIGGGFSGGDIVAGLGSVWASTGNGPLSRVDPAANAVVEQYERHGADALAVGEGSVWISDHDVDTVWRLPAG